MQNFLLFVFHICPHIRGFFFFYILKNVEYSFFFFICMHLILRPFFVFIFTILFSFGSTSSSPSFIYVVLIIGFFSTLYSSSLWFFINYLMIDVYGLDEIVVLDIYRTAFFSNWGADLEQWEDVFAEEKVDLYMDKCNNLAAQ